MPLRREAGLFVTGCVAALALKWFGSSPAAASDQVIVVLAVGIAAAVVFPAVEFGWRFITAAPELAARREREAAAQLERVAESQREAETQARGLAEELERTNAKLAIIAERALLAQELVAHQTQLQMHTQAPMFGRPGTPIPGIPEEVRRAEIERFEAERAAQVQAAGIRTQESIDRVVKLIRERGRQLGVEDFADRMPVIDVANPPTNHHVFREHVNKATQTLATLVQHLHAQGVHPMGLPTSDDVARFLRERDS